MSKFFTSVSFIALSLISTSLAFSSELERNPSQAGKILKGKIKKELCTDGGNMFSPDLGCKPMALGISKDCSVEFQYTDRSKFAVMTTNALKETKDSRKIDFDADFNKRFYASFQDGTHSYGLKHGKDLSSEIKFVKDKKGNYTVPEYILYTKHVTKTVNGKKVRTFHQYTCSGLK